MSNDIVFLVVLVALIYLAWRYTPSEKFEPSPPCPFRAQYASPDDTPGPDLRAIADMSLLATPPMPSPMAELFSQKAFFGDDARRMSASPQP